jgi:hypothetical protein
MAGMSEKEVCLLVTAVETTIPDCVTNYLKPELCSFQGRRIISIEGDGEPSISWNCVFKS